MLRWFRGTSLDVCCFIIWQAIWENETLFNHFVYQTMKEETLQTQTDYKETTTLDYRRQVDDGNRLKSMIKTWIPNHISNIDNKRQHWILWLNGDDVFSNHLQILSCRRHLWQNEAHGLTAVVASQERTRRSLVETFSHFQSSKRKRWWISNHLELIIYFVDLAFWEMRDTKITWSSVLVPTASVVCETVMFVVDCSHIVFGNYDDGGCLESMQLIIPCPKTVFKVSDNSP